MDQLWAPWRRQYVQETDTTRTGSDCFLCDAGACSAADPSLLVIAVSTHSIQMLNRFPYTGGHILVAPRRHCSSILDLSQDEYADLMNEVRSAVKTLSETYSPHGFNIGVNLGAAGGAGVPGHVHIHVVPRWNGDTNFMPVIGEVRVLSEDLIATWERLRAGNAEKPTA